MDPTESEIFATYETYMYTIVAFPLLPTPRTTRVTGRVPRRGYLGEWRESNPRLTAGYRLISTPSGNSFASSRGLCSLWSNQLQNRFAGSRVFGLVWKRNTPKVVGAASAGHCWPNSTEQRIVGGGGGGVRVAQNYSVPTIPIHRAQGGGITKFYAEQRSSMPNAVARIMCMTCMCTVLHGTYMERQSN